MLNKILIFVGALILFTACNVGPSNEDLTNTAEAVRASTVDAQLAVTAEFQITMTAEMYSPTEGDLLYLDWLSSYVKGTGVYFGTINFVLSKVENGTVSDEDRMLLSTEGSNMSRIILSMPTRQTTTDFLEQNLPSSSGLILNCNPAMQHGGNVAQNSADYLLGKTSILKVEQDIVKFFEYQPVCDEKLDAIGREMLAFKAFID